MPAKKNTSKNYKLLLDIGRWSSFIRPLSFVPITLVLFLYGCVTTKPMDTSWTTDPAFLIQGANYTQVEKEAFKNCYYSVNLIGKTKVYRMKLCSFTIGTTAGVSDIINKIGLDLDNTFEALKSTNYASFAAMKYEELLQDYSFNEGLVKSCKNNIGNAYIFQACSYTAVLNYYKVGGYVVGKSYAKVALGYDD